MEELKEKTVKELKKEIKKIKRQNLFIKIMIVITVIIAIYLRINFVRMHECYSIQIKHPSWYVPRSMKPIIYIYPEKEEEVTIKLSHPERLTTTYPKYEDEWKVIAKPDGTLIDTKTNRKLYSLYWEGKNEYKTDMTEGFVVKGEDTIKFLEEKLEILGLNEKEAEEFIIYWLPKMENNSYNYIYFENINEINEGMNLDITPAPETLIRIMMEFKSLDKPVDLREQELQKVERKGYTVVEWGGREIE